MSSQIKFTPIVEPIKDTITGDAITNGYKLLIPFEDFEKYNFSTKIKLYCPTCDFLKTPLMLHAWSINENGEIVNKETHINSLEWVHDMNFKQPSSLYWPGIQESNIQDFKYDVLFVVQPNDEIELPELVLEIE
jgi:hypothetical protein